MSGRLTSGGRMSGGRLSGGLKSPQTTVTGEISADSTRQQQEPVL